VSPELRLHGMVDFGGYSVSYGPNKHHGTNWVDIVIVAQGGRYCADRYGCPHRSRAAPGRRFRLRGLN